MSTHDCTRCSLSPEMAPDYCWKFLSQAVDETDEESDTLLDLFRKKSKDKSGGKSIAPFFRPEGLTVGDLNEMFATERGKAYESLLEQAETSATVMGNEGARYKLQKNGNEREQRQVPEKDRRTSVLLAIPPSVASQLWKQEITDYIFISLVDKIEIDKEGKETTTPQIAISSHNYTYNKNLSKLVSDRIKEMLLKEWIKEINKKIGLAEGKLKEMAQSLKQANLTVQIQGSKVNVTDVSNIGMSEGVKDPDIMAHFSKMNCIKSLTIEFDYEFQLKPGVTPTPVPQPASQVPTKSKSKSIDFSTPSGPVVIRR